MKGYHSSEITYTGIPVSEGVVIGNVLKLDSGPKPIIRYSIDESKIPEEITRFENAMIQTREEILEIQDKIAKAMGKNHASIFNAHLLIIEDFTVIEEVVKKIQKEKVNTEYAFYEVMMKFTKVFNEMEDEYLRERVADIKDVARRVLKNMAGEKKIDIPAIKDDVIVIAYDLSPSETAQMHKENIIGFATDIGGKTSHTAIMARSLGIPAVVGLHDVSSRVVTGSKVILDGNRGLLIVNPEENTIQKYSNTKSILESYEKKLRDLKELTAETLDGHIVQLHANIEMPEDLEAVIGHGGEGIGLYRTEYSYMNRNDLPSEEELFSIYKIVVEKMNSKPVVIRTMDIGGDKFLCHMKLPEEMNPFLGWRAIRFCLERVDIFKTQIRAILRASALGKVKIMFPMISNVTEVMQANHILKRCMKELKKEGIAFDENLEVGVMIEIPGAAIESDIIADYVDFFSIGTNDLIQYTLAVDRINEKIAYLYQPFHPAVLRLIQKVAEVGQEKGIEVDICGEMASDPAAVLLLLGFGIDKLSLSPFSIPKVKSVIRTVRFSDCKKLIPKVIKCTTSEEIKSIVDPIIKNIIPSFAEQ